MDAPPIDGLEFTPGDDDVVWVFTPGLKVWSTADDRYLFDEDFRASYPDAPAPALTASPDRQGGDLGMDEGAPGRPGRLRRSPSGPV